MIMILYVNEILIEFSYPTYGKGKSSSQPLGGDMLVPRRVFKKRERERDSFRFCLEWLYQRSFTWNTHVNLQSARWKKWWHRHLVSQCWEPIILLVVSTSQFATALQHLRLSENKVVEMTGNHQVKKSSGIPTHQTIKNRSAMNSAMGFSHPPKKHSDSNLSLYSIFPRTPMFFAHVFFNTATFPLLLFSLGSWGGGWFIGSIVNLGNRACCLCRGARGWRSCGPVLVGWGFLRLVQGGCFNCSRWSPTS